MSYAGSSPRQSRQAHRGAVPSPPSSAPVGRPQSLDQLRPVEVDWEQVAIFAAGLTIGLAAGAGAALLLAPGSGRETRRSLALVGRRMRRRSHYAWDDLRDELQRAARRGTRAITRSVEERRRDLAAARRRRKARLALDDE